MNIIIKNALESSYSRAIDDDDDNAVFRSTLFAILGWQEKYKYWVNEETKNGLAPKLDRNVYNWVEQFLFFPLRILKNVLKLFTEFLWNLGHEGFSHLADLYSKKATLVASENSSVPPSKVKSLLFKGLGYLSQGLSYVCWFIGKLGQSLTSPFTALKQTYKFVINRAGNSHDNWVKGLAAGVIASIHVSLIISAYTALAPFIAAFVVAPLLGAAGVAAFGFVMQWLPVLAVVKVILRHLSPKLAEPTAEFTNESRQRAARGPGHRLGHAPSVSSPPAGWWQFFRQLLGISKRAPDSAQHPPSRRNPQSNRYTTLNSKITAVMEDINKNKKNIRNTDKTIHRDDLLLLLLVFKEAQGVKDYIAVEFQIPQPTPDDGIEFVINKLKLQKRSTREKLEPLLRSALQEVYTTGSIKPLKEAVQKVLEAQPSSTAQAISSLVSAPPSSSPTQPRSQPILSDPAAAEKTISTAVPGDMHTTKEPSQGLPHLSLRPNG